MDNTLPREEAKELMSLLGLDMCVWGNLPLIRKAYLKQCKELHPDKGGDEEKMKRMNVLYKKLQDKINEIHGSNAWTYVPEEVPQYGTTEWEQWWDEFNARWQETEDNLRCDEEFDDKEEDQDYVPGGSQYTPPKKKKKCNEDVREFPECFKDCLSNAVLSNKTINCFLIYTTMEKSKVLFNRIKKRYNCNFVGRYKYNEDALLFVITCGKHRVSAIFNFCSRMCTVSFVLVKGVNKEKECYMLLTETPFEMLEESIPGGLSTDEFGGEEDAKQVSWKLICDYAQQIKCEDVYLLIGLYGEFADNVGNCEKCLKEQLPNHYKYHKDHAENAKLFAECKNQKNICQQAVDSVIAKKRVEILTLSRQQLLARRFMDLFEKMDFMFGSKSSFKIETFMAGVAWLFCLQPKMCTLIIEFLDCMTKNKPKNRYWLFKGPINSGKTTLAAGLLDLCGGKALNINLPFERINFELGIAIDQWMVCFEDVKGQTGENKDLPAGQGVNNLDNLRDHLDGSVQVNLEKKHVNKKTQIFPPGIVTMNEYKLPETLEVRFCKIVEFRKKKYLEHSLANTEELLQHRILQNGVTLLMMLVWFCKVDDFDDSLQEKVCYWKEILDNEISIERFHEMKLNVLMGKNIMISKLKNTNEETEEEEQQEQEQEQEQEQKAENKDTEFASNTQNTETTDSGVGNTQFDSINCDSQSNINIVYF